MKRIVQFFSNRTAAVAAAAALVSIVFVAVVLADHLEPRPVAPGFAVAPNLTPHGTPFPSSGSPPPVQTPAIVPLPRFTPAADLKDPRLLGTPLAYMGTPAPVVLTPYRGYLPPNQALLDVVNAASPAGATQCAAASSPVRSNNLRATLCLQNGWKVITDRADVVILSKAFKGSDQIRIVFYLTGQRPDILLDCPNKGVLNTSGTSASVCFHNMGQLDSHLIGLTIPAVAGARNEVWVGIETRVEDASTALVPEREALTIIASMITDR
jgi:hypothetical protein